MNIRDAMLNAEKGIFPKRFQETETSGAVAAAAPEHVIDIAYNDDEDHLTESEELISGLGLRENLNDSKEDFDDLENNVVSELKERIKTRKLFNKRLTEAIKEDKVEEINNSEKPLGRVRYKLQRWINGGTPYVDEEGVAKKDGEVGGPSSYEQWRHEMNDKKRTARLEQERDDANSSFHSPRITQADPEGTVDNVIDQYLAQYVKDHEDPENGEID